MFLDACVIIALITSEETAIVFEKQIGGAKSLSTSVLASFEAALVLSRPDKFNCSITTSSGIVIEWLDARNIVLREPAVPRRVLALAAKVADTLKVGKKHLSAFDCLHYAYAKALRQPLVTSDKILLQSDAV